MLRKLGFRKQRCLVSELEIIDDLSISFYLFPHRFLRLELCSEKLSDETYRLVNFPRDDSNGLRDLGLHLARCFVDETQKLIDKKEIDGMSVVDDVNLEEVKRLSLQVTDGLINLGKFHKI